VQDGILKREVRVHVPDSNSHRIMHSYLLPKGASERKVVRRKHAAEAEHQAQQAATGRRQI
jgi:formiminotetrahydrofolate cyclodeaminase